MLSPMGTQELQEQPCPTRELKLDQSALTGVGTSQLVREELSAGGDTTAAIPAGTDSRTSSSITPHGLDPKLTPNPQGHQTWLCKAPGWG